MKTTITPMINKAETYAVLNNILGFWSRNMVDMKHGGFYGRIDGQHQLDVKADKGVILNARILWSYSAAYQLTDNPRFKMLADRAYEYFVKYFIDSRHGGAYWMLDCTGLIKDTKKQIYAQAFAIYALSEYHKINPYRRALDHSRYLFELIEAHSFDPQNNGYIEALDREWQAIADVRLSDKDLNATKTMNTHLHVLEAYTNLYRIWPNQELKTQLINLIRMMSTTFLYDSGHFKLFFGDEWKLLSDEYSFGHDIEGSWLLFEAAEVLQEEALIGEVKDISMKMVHAALEGMDHDGGLMNEANAQGLTDTDKHWWPQAEALVGLANAWQLTGEEVFLDHLSDVWQFTKKHIVTPDWEWRWRVSRDGQPYEEEDVAGPWKCPYHNSRAMIELNHRLSE